MSIKKIVKEYFPLIAGFIFGFFISSLATLVLAHGGNTSFIHACVKTNNGDIRIVSPNDSCASNETPLDWSQNGIDTFGGFTTNQLIVIESNFDNERFKYRNFSGANFTDSTFNDANITRIAKFTNN